MKNAMVEVAISSPNRHKIKEFGPYSGKDEADIRQQALAAAKMQFGYASDYEIIEVRMIKGKLDHIQFSNDKIIFDGSAIKIHSFEIQTTPIPTYVEDITMRK